MTHDNYPVYRVGKVDASWLPLLLGLLYNLFQESKVNPQFNSTLNGLLSL